MVGTGGASKQMLLKTCAFKTYADLGEGQNQVSPI
jgi:hypothetical protein